MDYLIHAHYSANHNLACFLYTLPKEWSFVESLRSKLLWVITRILMVITRKDKNPKVSMSCGTIHLTSVHAHDAHGLSIGVDWQVKSFPGLSKVVVHQRGIGLA